MKRYGITYIARDGLRTLAYPAQGRNLRDTREEAEEQMEAILTNTHADTIRQLFGNNPRFAVREFDCYEHGDPKSIYAD